MDFSRRDFLIGAALTGAVSAFGSDHASLLTSAPAAGTGAAGAAPVESPVRIVAGRCHECHVQCFNLVHVQDGRILKVEGDPKGPNRGALCGKGQATVKNLYSPERLN